MIVPSVDVLEGRAVQLVGGEPGAPGALDLGDPMALAEKLSVAGEIAIVDLGAALGTGDDEALIASLVKRFPARVGGGIRSVEKAMRLLDAGATKVILGTAATPELLSRLPKERCIAALDESGGHVVTHGWQQQTELTVEQGMARLAPHVSGFLVTSVDREGREQGLDQNLLLRLARYREMDVTIAGGITSAAEIRVADQHGFDAQVGMAFHTGKLLLADAIAAPLKPSDRPDGLWPTLVVDVHGIALGLAYSNRESLRKAVETRRGVYWSRQRGLWIKGESSGDRQDLLGVALDCDRDTLRFTVRQHGRGFCHEGWETCFGDRIGIPAEGRRVEERLKTVADAKPGGSYTHRLLSDPALLRSKLIEEAGELADAKSAEHAAEEFADVVYFSLVRLLQAGGTLEEVERILEQRARRVTRRPGDAKPG
ncbi:MAG TPA: phosphoribosyl-ATP diphosphatase [Myxococcales bacterium]|jgi:phosphoribosyl-ATP pyrophosphohydrolase